MYKILKDAVSSMATYCLWKGNEFLSMKLFKKGRTDAVTVNIKELINGRAVEWERID